MTNVVLIVMDTVRAMEFDSWNSTEVRGLADLSSNGTTFSRAFSSAPWTLPSHASLFTGTPPSKHGAHAGHKKLDSNLATIAEVLSDEGYETVAVSNNTWISEEFGFGRGFETFHKTWQYVQSDTDLGEIARTNEGLGKLREVGLAMLKGNPVVNLANAVYGRFLRKSEDDGAERTNDWLVQWLATREDSRPFYLFVNYLEPHLEYRPPEAYAERYLPEGVPFSEAMNVSQDAWGYIAGDVELSDEDFEILRALYKAEIAYLAERIHGVKTMLQDAGEWEDTVFIVTSDHGENIGDHALMDHQYALYDSLIHVPLFVHGEPFENGEVDELVQLIDLPPTILDILDIEASAVREQFQGRSFHPDSSTSPRDYVIAEYMAPQPSMEALERRVGTLPESIQKFDRSLRAIRGEEWKLIRGSDGEVELYNVAYDHAETKNRANERIDVVDDLSTELDEWLDSFEHANLSGDVAMKDETEQRLYDLGYLQ